MPGYKWNGFIARLTNKLRYWDPKEKEEKIRKNTYGITGKCVFCEIVDRGEEILHRDDEIAVFRDRKRDAQAHLLVVPVRHVKDLSELEIRDVRIVEKMYENGLRLLQSLCPDSEYVFGFHHPPRMSIGHLHMHCIAKPFVHFKSKFSYSSMLWLITPQELIRKLQNEAR